jgi:hypothetical protein
MESREIVKHLAHRFRVDRRELQALRSPAIGPIAGACHEIDALDLLRIGVLVRTNRIPGVLDDRRDVRRKERLVMITDEASVLRLAVDPPASSQLA